MTSIIAPPPPPPAEQPCRYCCEPLRARAVYCKTCEQFQTAGARWRNELTFSALLGALPLFALVYGFIHDRTTRVRSEVRALALQCGIETVVVGLTNGGNRPAVVAGGTLTRTGRGGTSAWALTNGAKDGALLVEPAKQVIARFGVGNDAIGQPPAAGPGEQCTYSAKLNVVEFGETKPREEVTTCACPVA
ncbi:hypothetical protein U1701_07655 [Sphingomonas sp. PB2P19]|uniref:hypothetical protein n=1 Tax=Sphingomonas rhamnosi TaxID=3096156 RepID=UPI002FC97FC4